MTTKDFHSDTLNADGQIAMLEEFNPAERIGAQFKEGTQFITRTGKLTVERIRPGITIICGDGKHRTVVWAKRTGTASPEPVETHAHHNNVVALYKTRFPNVGYRKPSAEAQQKQNAPIYWLVLSEAVDPRPLDTVKTPRYVKGKSEARWAMLDALEEELKGEAEIINIFAAKQRLAEDRV